MKKASYRLRVAYFRERRLRQTKDKNIILPDSVHDISTDKNNTSQS